MSLKYEPASVTTTPRFSALTVIINLTRPPHELVASAKRCLIPSVAESADSSGRDESLGGAMYHKVISFGKIPVAGFEPPRVPTQKPTGNVFEPGLDPSRQFVLNMVD